jgi:hypothetical protein
MLDLIMQTAQHAFGRTRMVVLHELDARLDLLGKLGRVRALEEETTRVAEHLRSTILTSGRAVAVTWMAMRRDP